MKISAPKMVTFANVFVLGWKICPMNSAAVYSIVTLLSLRFCRYVTVRFVLRVVQYSCSATSTCLCSAAGHILNG